MLLYLCQIFIFLLGHLHFFLHFFLSLMENLFKKHPILMYIFPVFSSIDGGHFEGDGAVEDRLRRDGASGRRAKILRNRRSLGGKPISQRTRRMHRSTLERSR